MSLGELTDVTCRYDPYMYIHMCIYNKDSLQNVNEIRIHVLGFKICNNEENDYVLYLPFSDILC